MLGISERMMGYCPEGEYVLDLRTGARSEGKASPGYEADSGYSVSPQGSPSPPTSPHGLGQRLASSPLHSPPASPHGLGQRLAASPLHTPPASPDSGRPAALVQRVLDAPAAATRPFKAYPRNPLVLGGDEAFLQFRERMLSKVRTLGKGCGASKARASVAGSEERDAAYWERRRKNNEAAKRSRDARRAKEDEIAIRAAFLEQENMRLKYEMASLKEESAALRALLYSAPPDTSLHPIHHHLPPLYHH